VKIKYQQGIGHQQDTRESEKEMNHANYIQPEIYVDGDHLKGDG